MKPIRSHAALGIPTPKQIEVLAMLRERGEAGDFVERLDHERRLVAAGWVQPIAQPNAAGRQRVRITEAGIATLPKPRARTTQSLTIANLSVSAKVTRTSNGRTSFRSIVVEAEGSPELVGAVIEEAAKMMGGSS